MQRIAALTIASAVLLASASGAFAQVQKKHSSMLAAKSTNALASAVGLPPPTSIDSAYFDRAKGNID